MRGGPRLLGTEPGGQESELSQVDGDKPVLRLRLGWFCSNPWGRFPRAPQMSEKSHVSYFRNRCTPGAAWGGFTADHAAAAAC